MSNKLQERIRALEREADVKIETVKKPAPPAPPPPVAKISKTRSAPPQPPPRPSKSVPAPPPSHSASTSHLKPQSPDPKPPSPRSKTRRRSSLDSSSSSTTPSSTTNSKSLASATPPPLAEKSRFSVAIGSIFSHHSKSGQHQAESHEEQPQPRPQTTENTAQKQPVHRQSVRIAVTNCENRDREAKGTDSSNSVPTRSAPPSRNNIPSTKPVPPPVPDRSSKPPGTGIVIGHDDKDRITITVPSISAVVTNVKAGLSSSSSQSGSQNHPSNSTAAATAPSNKSSPTTSSPTPPKTTKPVSSTTTTSKSVDPSQRKVATVPAASSSADAGRKTNSNPDGRLRALSKKDYSKLIEFRDRGIMTEQEFRVKILQYDVLEGRENEERQAFLPTRIRRTTTTITATTSESPAKPNPPSAPRPQTAPHPVPSKPLPVPTPNAASSPPPSTDSTGPPRPRRPLPKPLPVPPTDPVNHNSTPGSPQTTVPQAPTPLPVKTSISTPTPTTEPVAEPPPRQSEPWERLRPIKKEERAKPPPFKNKDEEIEYHRKRCINEIMETEQTYVYYLHCIVDIYIKPLKEWVKSRPNGQITLQDVSSIFSDLEIMTQFNTVFLESLEANIQSERGGQSKTGQITPVSGKPKPIGQLFVELAPFFKTYMRYCNNYDVALRSLNKCFSNAEFKDLLVKLDADERTNMLGLKSFLIMPIQRMPRYRLLLQDLKEHTNQEKHPDEYKYLELALEKIREVADHLNNSIKLAEQGSQIVTIQNSFSPALSLLEPHRRFVREGAIMRISENEGKKKDKKTYVHLFNDLLLYSKKTGQYKFVLNGQIGLSNAMITDANDDEKHVFQIQDFDGNSVMLVVQSREEKESWMGDIRQNINTLNRQSVAVGLREASQRVTVQNPLEWKKEFNITGRNAISLMKQGTTMLKHCSNARPHFRMVRLSQDEQYIMWSSPKRWKTEEKCKIHVCDIMKVVPGEQNTIAFRKYRNEDLAVLSISIISRSKSLGLVCTDQRDFKIWSEGLKELTTKAENRSSVVSASLESVISSSSDEATESESNTEALGPEEEKAANVAVDPSEIAPSTKNFKEEFSKRGDAYMWGCGASGVLGNGSTKDQQRPLVLRDLLCMDVSSISCGGSVTAIVMRSGQLFTFGSGECGKLGHGDQGDRLKPSFVRSLRNVTIVQASVGAKHMLALDENGIVYAWGSNAKGQLGLDEQELCPVDDDDEIVEMEETPIPTEQAWRPHVVTSLLPTEDRRVVRVCAGNFHSACIFDDGTLLTWGCNEEGQLGLGHKHSVTSPTVVEKLVGKNVADISLGADHSVAQTEGGLCFTWGSNSFGQLGHPNFGDSSTDSPKMVDFFQERRIHIRCVSAGGSHTACITENGELYIFGLGLYGQMGNGRKENTSTPLLILETLHTSSVDRVVQVALGANHSMILMESGKLFAWGAGTYGRLGLGNEQDTAFPTQVQFFNDREVRQISSGGSQSAAVCAHMLMPEKEVSSCMGCGDMFSRSRRKNHCRFCGGLFCADCTSKSLTLLNFGYTKPVRVCGTCYALNRLRDL